MEFFTLLIGLLGLVITLYFLLRQPQRPKNYPPGPPGIPIFGNALQIGDQVHKHSVKLAATYGPILGFRNGSYWAVVLNNAEDIREAYSRPEFAGRFGYNPFIEENVTTDTKGVVMSQGPAWQEIRRFSLKTLREFGFGKRSMESAIHEEIQELIEEKFKKNLGKPLQNHGLFNASVLNVIWGLVAGERYKLNDERLAELLNFITENFANSFDGLKFLSFVFPALVKLRQWLPFNLPDSNKPGQKKLLDFLKKTIQEHRNTIQVGSPRDFIDVYLEERMGNNKSVDSIRQNAKSSEDDTQLAYTLYDFFGAGSDTTSTTLSWALFLLALHQDVQEELYQEILAQAGSRRVQLDDRQNMPMTEAVMLEVHRMASLAPIGVPHATTQDVDFKGFRIPRNTMIFANLYACHYSTETWGDPTKFRPARFLSADRKTFNRHPNVLPFSVGKRQCLGETVAKDELFLFLTNIVQQLKIVMPQDEPGHTLEGQRGLVLTPEPHRIVLLDRNQS